MTMNKTAGRWIMVFIVVWCERCLTVLWIKILQLVHFYVLTLRRAAAAVEPIFRPAGRVSFTGSSSVFHL